jgi:hypothetical protein
MQALSMRGEIKLNQKIPSSKKSPSEPFLTSTCLNRHQAGVQFSGKESAGAMNSSWELLIGGIMLCLHDLFTLSVTNRAFFHYLCHIFKMLVTKYVKKAFKVNAAVCMILGTRQDLPSPMMSRRRN